MEEFVYLLFLVGKENYSGSMFINAFKTRELAQRFIDLNGDGLTLTIVETKVMKDIV